MQAGYQGRETCLPDVVYECGAESGEKSMEHGEI